MYYHIYCKTDCPYCKEAIDFLDENKEEFVVTIMDKCSQFERVVKESAGMKNCSNYHETGAWEAA